MVLGGRAGAIPPGATNPLGRKGNPTGMRWIFALLVAGMMAGCAEQSDAAAPTEPEDPGFYTGQLGELVVPEAFTHFGETLAYETNRSGQGIWVEEGVLFSTNGRDLHIFDVRDPQNVTLLGALEDLPGARDVDVLTWNDHRLAVVAGSGQGMHIIDVADPEAPVMLTSTEVLSAGVHNLAAVDGTPYVYVAGASGERKIDVVDLTDPYNPTISFFLMPESMTVNGVPGVPLNSNGCHDITVRVDLARAYCAGGGSQYMSGGGESFIWDITEVKAPKWLAAIDDPRLIYHHQAFVNDDGTRLIINDEYIGAYQIGAGANNCFRADTPLPGDAEQVPFAAAWIYDISDETSPQYLSFVQNPAGWSGDGLPPSPVEGNCGAHFGDIIAGHDAFVMGWYQGGTVLVDFTDGANPVVLDVSPPAGSTWDSMYYDGWVYHSSGDLVLTALA